MARNVLFDPVPSIAPTGPVDAQQRIQTPEDAFGGGIAKAISQVGAAGEKLGETGMQIATARQMLDNEVHASEVNTWLANKITDRHAQYAVLEGRAAMDALPQYKADVEDLYQQSMKQAGSPAEEAALAKSGRYLTTRYMGWGTNHASSQWRSWADKTAADRATTYGNQAMVAQANGDEKAADVALNTSDDEVRKLFEQKGYDQDAITAEVAKNRGRNVSRMIETAGEESPVKAQQLFKKYQSEMDAASQAAVIGKLRSAHSQIVGRGIADEESGHVLPKSEPVGNVPASFAAAVKQSEGFTPVAKWDYKQNSVGYGTRARFAGETVTKEEADKRFNEEFGKASKFVDSVNPNLDAGSRAALSSLTYNAGETWATSGLGDAVRAGDMVKARQIFLQYNQAGGAPNAGLMARRGREAEWFGQNAPGSQLQAADTAMKLAPEEKALYQRHLGNLIGAGGVDNPDGSRSTLFATTVGVDDRTFIIPTVWDGKILPPDQAMQRAKAEGLDKFPSYATVEEAQARYDQLHSFMEKDTAAFKAVPADPRLQARRYREASWFGMPEAPAGGQPLVDKATAYERVLARTDQTPQVQNAAIARLNQVYSIYHSREVQNNATFDQRIKDTRAEMFATGKTSQPLTETEFVNRFGVEQGLKHFKDYQKDTVLAADIATVATMSPAEQREVLERQLPREGEGYAAQSERFKAVHDAMDRAAKARDADPAQFALSRLPAVQSAYQGFNQVIADQKATPAMKQAAAQQFANVMLAEQSRIGVTDANRRLLPKGYIDQLNAKLERPVTAGGTSGVADAISAEAALWGENWPLVEREIAKTARPTVRVIASGVQPMAARLLVDLEPHSAQTILKDESNEKLLTVQTAVRDAVKPFAKTLIGQDAAATTLHDFEGQILKLSAYYVGTGDMTPQVAADRAFKEVLGHKYEFRGNLRIPKDVPYTPAEIERGTQRAGFVLQRYDIRLPVDTMGGLDEQYRRNAAIKTLQRDAQWVTASGDAGAMLVWKDAVVRKSDGSPLIMPWAELGLLAKSNAPEFLDEEQRRRGGVHDRMMKATGPEDFRRGTTGLHERYMNMGTPAGAVE